MDLITTVDCYLLHVLLLEPTFSPSMDQLISLFTLGGMDGLQATISLVVRAQAQWRCLVTISRYNQCFVIQMIVIR